MDEQDADAAVVTFGRLTDIPVAQVHALLNERRNHRHMPLAGEFSEEDAVRWARDKDAQWDQHGYGPEAILVRGQFAGWGGFQHEPAGADLSLVLAPPYWGLGAAIAVRLLDRGFGEFGLGQVVVALPFTRGPAQVLARFGFRPDGTVTYGRVEFQQFRLVRAEWMSRGGARLDNPSDRP